jgi:hypothetical protein
VCLFGNFRLTHNSLQARITDLMENTLKARDAGQAGRATMLDAHKCLIYSHEMLELGGANSPKASAYEVGGASTSSTGRWPARAADVTNMLCCLASTTAAYLGVPRTETPNPITHISTYHEPQAVSPLRFLDAQSRALLPPQLPQHHGLPTLLLDLDGASAA